MHKAHDLLFRHVFSDPQNAAGELRVLLPAELTSRIEWSSLKLASGSFVDEALSELHTDLLFTVSLDQREALLYLLMEHQSSPDGMMPLRLLEYLARVWRKYLRDHPAARRLPAIIPMVVHHSERGWTESTNMHQLLDIEPATLALIGRYIPSFEFLLDDLSGARDEDLRARAMTALGRVALVCLSRARGMPDLASELSRWMDLLRETVDAPNGVAALAAIMSYILNVTETAPEQLQHLAQQLGPRGEEAYMTGEQILVERNREKWRAEGQVSLLLKQLAQRFGALSPETTERVRHATSEQLETWAERVLTAASLEEVLG